MYAVEFNAQAHNHFIRVPDEIPDGMEMRVLLLLKNNQPSQQTMPDTATTPDLKQLLMSLTDGLTDEDLARPLDMGRSIA
jgi:hypothetical protein